MNKEFTDASGNYRAQILKDSMSPDDIRLSTILVRFPRFILAEANTHRMFSRNSASSRAIPTERLIEQVRTNPFIPKFNKRVKGMGVGESFNDQDQLDSMIAWTASLEAAIKSAERLVEIGVDKSRANRLLEPFMWHSAVITATEWQNWFGLRCPPGDEPTADFPAQLEIQQLALLMREAMQYSQPADLDIGAWHMPLIDYDKDWKWVSGTPVEQTLDVAARRLARISFDTHMETEPMQVSLDKSGELKAGGHWSPFEHLATPIGEQHMSEQELRKVMRISLDDVWQLVNKNPTVPASEVEVTPAMIWTGNLRGYIQYRKTFKNEDNHLRSVKK